MRAHLFSTIVLLTLLAIVPVARAQSAAPELERQVEAVERAFAKSMADRDIDAFRELVSEEAVFLGGGTALRGRQAVLEHWSRYFEGATAPFSWEPETVAVLESGRLGISTGPVLNAEGVRTSTYTSIWRLNSAGEWRIVFDKGDRYCE